MIKLIAASVALVIVSGCCPATVVNIIVPPPILRGSLPVIVLPPVLPPAVPLPMPKPAPVRKPVPEPSSSYRTLCAVVVLVLRKFDRATLEAMARENGITPDQWKAALACEKESHP